MTIEYLGVRTDFIGSLNSIDLRVRGDFSLTDKCRIVIERPGQNRPFLTESGWQSNYKKCVIDVVPSGECDFDLCRPLGFAQFLDPEYNYKVEVFDMADESVGIFGMNWTPPPRIKTKSVDPVVPPPMEPPDDPTEDAPIVPDPKTAPYEPPKPPTAQRTVLNCVRCKGQIFSTFQVCPYCGTPVHQH